MILLSNNELINIYGGTYKNTPFYFLEKFYRTMKIKWLMKKLFID